MNPHVMLTRSMLTRRFWLMRPAISGLWVLLVLVSDARASKLDDQLTAFRKPNATQTETIVTQILETGIAEHRSAEAMAAVQPWLNRNHLQTQQAMFHAAQAAEFSGQWQTAVGLYQRLLQVKNVNPNAAGAAVDATYRLLINSIGDGTAAYLFMRRDGNRLRSLGTAKRFDRWFLDQAIKRRDLVAMCDRLVVMVNDRATDKSRLLVDFEWLCTEYEKYRKEAPDAYEAAIRLSAANALAGFKARLKWVATVMRYNQQLDELREANAPADAKLTEVPLAAAAELLKVDPDRGAFLVAQGWGVEYDHGHSGNCAKRFSIEGEKKLAQLLAVLPRMSADKRDDLLAFEIAQNRVKFRPEVIRKAVLDYPGMLNSLTASNVPLFDKTITVEEAKKLAPQLTRNPHAQAAMVRAWARPERKYSVVADQMMQHEMWRFNDVKMLTHGVWHSGMFERDVDHDVPIKKYSNLDSRYQQLKKQVDATAKSQDRITAFNRLYRDLISDTPTTPGALLLWDELFAQAPDTDLSQMFKVLVADTSGERGGLLQRALGKARFGEKKSGSMLWEGEVYSNQFRYHRQPVQESVPDLILHLQGLIASQNQAGNIDPIIFGMWLHTVDPKQADAIVLIDKLVTSAAYLKLDSSYHNSVADGNHFGMTAATEAIMKAQPRYISRELLGLSEDSTPQVVEAAFNAVFKRVAAWPQPVAVVGLQPVAALPTWSDQIRRQVLTLFRENMPIGEYPTRQGYEQLIQRICNDLTEKKQWGEIEPYLSGLWYSVAWTDDHNHYRGAAALSQFGESAMEAGWTSIALSTARNGSMSRAAREMKASINPAKTEVLGRVSQVQGKASIELGVIDIPVDELDPTYPIYKSQAEFALGNVGAAWDLYDNNAELLAVSTDEPLIRKLTPGYCLWLLERSIQDRATDRAEALVKELMIWSRRAAGSFTPQQEADLKIAYADTAFQKGNYQTARAWYRRVADAAEHQQSELQYKSALRSVMVDRVSRNFGSAITELDKLMLIRDENLRKRVHFARAEIFFDQEKFADAYDEVALVLKSEPNHADGLILLGKAQLEMRKLVDAAEIELGATRDQGVIVPGEMIKINLNDPSLNVAGVGADIEVEIWAESGDRERVMLYQLGDDKSKYRAEVPTKLAAPQPGDKTLQVLGRDKIQFGYSKEFRAKMTDLPPDPEVAIGVASNARLDISAGAFPTRVGERRLDLSELGVSTAQQALGTRNVRPGNPVYLRVFDPDQSTTDGADEIVVSLSTDSGDLIAQQRLVETGTHTGEFEAIIPTGTAQALAYASETAPGRDPNMVISAEPYPGWAGVIGSRASERVLGIDLNDNVPLASMIIRCEDRTLTPTHFVVQTSLNGRDWTTRARFPDDPAPWDGRPNFASFHTRVGGVSLTTPQAYELPADWLETMEATSVREACRFVAANVANLSSDSMVVDPAGHPNSSMLVRFRALFYQPEAAIRTFRLNGLPSSDRAHTVFLIDGQPVPEDADDPLTIVRELRPGLHEIQVWRTEQRGELQKQKPQLLCDNAGGEDLQLCPDSMFDPSTFPPLVRQEIPQPAVVTASEDDTEFNFAFADNTQARVVRMVIVSHEGAAPAIDKIALIDRDGTQRLPVETDYQQLRDNQTLEVIPGDQISVRYEDDRIIARQGNNTKTTARYEGRLGVAYNTALISASFLNYELDSEGERHLVLEDIRRFRMDDAVAIVIADADMDTSPDRDQVEFTIAAVGQSADVTSEPDPQSAKLRRMIALETEPHSGVFLGRVFPVSTVPTRDSEIQVSDGGTLTATYRDAENLDPGIPTNRRVTIEHARYRTPSLAVYNVTTEKIGLSNFKNDKNRKEESDDDDNGPEIILPRRTLNYTHLDAVALTSEVPHAVIGASLRFDVIAPHLAFADSSTITAYVQTERGRKAAADSALPFDVRVPGTLKLTGLLSDSHVSSHLSTRRRNEQISATAPGYLVGRRARPPTNLPPLDDGRFSFDIPLKLDELPARSYGTSAAESLPSLQIPDALAVRPGDKVHIGYAFKDKQGNPQWHTSTVILTSDTFLDVMNGRYRREISKAFVGEKLYVRLIAPGLDQNPERDVANVTLKADSGVTTPFQLRETSAHSGHFKGSFTISYASEPLGDKLPSVELHGFPVKYGDQVTISVSGSMLSVGETKLAASPSPVAVAINRGADGAIEPFSKRYGEDGVAVKTTFTLAECFFELAKHHRKMDQESLARREMGHAQKLLAEAIASHQEDELKAHAEYLLGNLAQEYADLSKNEDSKKVMYQDALARFSKIPLDYPDTEFAPQAQFKKALVYEKMNELDIAVEEYVKLAYKYPEHELIPSVMSRLGAYFQQQGLTYKNQAETLEKKVGDVEQAGEAIRLRDLATKEYLDAATVFGKLQSRFPEDPLAGLAGLRSAMNYMRAGDYETAIDAFKLVVDNETYDGREIRAQALFWSGVSHERLLATAEAYQIYRRTTFDFPDSNWAKRSRGRLADPIFARIIELEKEAREQLLEGLKSQR